MENYDFIIVGGGIYGIYAAKMLSPKRKVLLLDMDSSLFSRATYVNQARLHNGYHYPRSIETAMQANHYFEKFQKDYEDSIYRDFNKIYAISKTNTLTSAQQYEEFCSKVGISCSPIDHSEIFKDNTIEQAYLTKEFSFDYKKVLSKMLEDISFKIELRTQITSVKKNSDHFVIKLSSGKTIKTGGVINATYASINQINRLFGFDMLDVKYELCEMALCRPPESINGFGITIMDGMFFSIMPFGRDDLYSISSVRYTPHKTSWNNLPKFDCQLINNTCTEYQLNNCNNCLSCPPTAFEEMQSRAKEYLKDSNIEHINSIFAIKAIAKSAEKDDARLVSFKEGSKSPYYASVFSGKINCIYELQDKLKNFI